MERLWTPYVDFWPKYVYYPIWITGIHMDKISYSIWLVKHSIWIIAIIWTHVNPIFYIKKLNPVFQFIYFNVQYKV